MLAIFMKVVCFWCQRGHHSRRRRRRSQNVPMGPIHLSPSLMAFFHVFHVLRLCLPCLHGDTSAPAIHPSNRPSRLSSASGHIHPSFASFIWVFILIFFYCHCKCSSNFLCFKNTNKKKHTHRQKGRPKYLVWWCMSPAE